MRIASGIAAFLVASTSLAAGGRQRAIRPIPPVVAAQWTAPQCASVSGLPGLYFSRDEGRTIVNGDSPGPNAIVLLAVTDISNRLYAVSGDGLYESRDAGCRWIIRARVPTELTGMVTTAGGRAYAWSYVHNQLLRITPASSDTVSLPDAVIGVGVDAHDALLHLIAVSKRRAYESFDAGETWRDNGPAPYGLLNAVAFDPRDVRHIAVGYTHAGSVTRDGGLAWQNSDTQMANVWSLAFAPTDSNVIWMQGLVPYGAQTIYRSNDGGLTYREVLSAQQGVHFNAAPLFPHPNDADMIAFRSWEGLAFFEAKSRSVRLGPLQAWDSVTWSPAAGVIYLTAHTDLMIDP